jgi:hypothetical protein
LRDDSEDLRGGGEEDSSVMDTRRRRKSILSNIMRPVFSSSNSRIALLSSSFLIPVFIFRRKSMRIIDESIKGYIQLLLIWKNNEQPLDFIPLEKVEEEDYYPEEIEEEVILPYSASNIPTAIQRKVTSYSSDLAQGTEVQAMDDNNNVEEENDDYYSSSKDLTKATLRKSAISDERTRYESSSQKKSLKKNTAFREDDDQSSKSEAESSTQSKRYSVSKSIEDFNSEDVTPLGKNSSFKEKSPFKAHSDILHLNRKESTQLAPGIDLSENKKKVSSSPPPNEFPIFSPLKKQRESYEPPKISKSPSNDNENSSIGDRQSKMENYKLAKIQAGTKYTSQNRLTYEGDKSKKIMAKSTKESIKHDFASPGQSTSNYHDGRIVSNKQDKSAATTTTIDEDNNKSQIHTPTSAVNHREQKISSTIDSRKIHHVNDVLPQEDSVTSSINFSNISKLRASRKPKTKTIFDAVPSASDSSEKIAETDKLGAPTININKLDVTVVGDSSRSSTNTVNPLMEIAESSDETSHYSSEYDLESLNKSYLWKYKVKF